MKVNLKVWCSAFDGGDGSQTAYFFNTKEEALENLDRTEEEIQNGTFYDDGSIKETVIKLETDENGKLRLADSFGFSTDVM